MRPVLPALLLAAAVGALAPGAADARDRVRPERLTVLADVVDVRPVYRQVRYSEPRRECWTEEVRHVVREGYVDHRGGHGYSGHGYSNDGRAVVGGLVGGIVGNQIARRGSRGERAGATIAGAIVGSVIGNETSAGSARHRDRRHVVPRTVHETRPVERCRTVERSRAERRLQHYDVTYAYEGRTYTTRLPRDPGPTLELNVTLTPARR